MVRVLLIGLLAAAAGVARADDIRWRSDYAAARKEAETKQLPLLIAIGSDDCHYCRKQDSTTFRDPALIELVNRAVVPVRVAGTASREFVRALGVKMYPTTVLAAPDGTIAAFLAGYATAEQLSGPILRLAPPATPAVPEWAARDAADADKAVAGGDDATAVELYRGLASDLADQPLRTHARQEVAKIEARAADKLAKADGLASDPAAVAAYADVLRTAPGTPAAASATGKLAALAARPELASQLRGPAARELNAVLQDRLRHGRVADALDLAGLLRTHFPGTPEAAEANGLVAQMTADPARLAEAADQQAARTAATYLALADAHATRGDNAAAVRAFDRVVQVAPQSRHAAAARARLAVLAPGAMSGRTVGFDKGK